MILAPVCLVATPAFGLFYGVWRAIILGRRHYLDGLIHSRDGFGVILNLFENARPGT